MSSASLSRYALALGTRDTVTGWCKKDYTTTYTIIGSIQPKGAVMGALPLGNYASYPHTLFTPDAIHIGDHVKDAQGSYYEVRAADQWWRLNQFAHYVCNLEKISPYDPTRPDTSATWHTDSDSVKTDPRERTITWLNTYDNPASIGGDYAFMFGGADYPFQLEFIDNSLDALYVVEAPESTPEYTNDHYPYKFNESVNIHIYAINRTAITAPVILEQMEQQIRDIATDYPTYHTSLRALTSVKSEPITLGSLKLWHSIVSLRYSRENDDYVATYPTITYGDTQASTYIFPNVIDMVISDPETGEAILHPSGRIGSITQILGMEDFEITIISDLTIEHTNLTWKRSQTGAKTDVTEWQIFDEIKFKGKTDNDQVYQNLNLGTGAVIPVRLISKTVNRKEGLLTVIFRRYTATDGAGSTYNAWYGYA